MSPSKPDKLKKDYHFQRTSKFNNVSLMNIHPQRTKQSLPKRKQLTIIRSQNLYEIISDNPFILLKDT